MLVKLKNRRNFDLHRTKVTFLVSKRITITISWINYIGTWRIRKTKWALQFSNLSIIINKVYRRLPVECPILQMKSNGKFKIKHDIQIGKLKSWNWILISQLITRFQHLKHRYQAAKNRWELTIQKLWFRWIFLERISSLTRPNITNSSLDLHSIHYPKRNKF